MLFRSLIAGRLWDRLEAAGVPVAGRPGSEPTSPAPSRRHDALWMATKGTRWFLRRSVDLIPYMLFMAAREALTEPREWPVAPGPASPSRSDAQAAEPVAE